MTKIKTLVNEIFAKYNVELAAEEPKAEVKTELATATLKDGTVIQSDSETWEVGVNAYVVNEDGEKVAVPTGEYELEDGRILVVTEGIVDALNDAEEPAAEEEVEEEVEASKEDTTEEATEKVEASEVVKAEFSKEDVSEMLEKMATTLRAEFSDQLDQKDEEIKAKGEELEALKENFEHKGLPKAPEAPAARPSQKEISKLSPKERVAQLHNLYK